MLAGHHEAAILGPPACPESLRTTAERRGVDVSADVLLRTYQIASASTFESDGFALDYELLATAGALDPRLIAEAMLRA